MPLGARQVARTTVFENTASNSNSAGGIGIVRYLSPLPHTSTAWWSKSMSLMRSRQSSMRRNPRRSGKAT
jgi:hypothetical protein